MDKAMRWLSAAAVALATASLAVAPASALTDTASTDVTADVPLRADLALVRDDNSQDRELDPEQILFDRYDDQDGLPDGNPHFMYAPYRSEEGLNWHLLSIVANGESMTLTADVTGSAGDVDLLDIMDVYSGGFYEVDGNPKGGESGDWELLDTFERELLEPFAGTLPLGYRLRVRSVVAGTHVGNVTFTLVSGP